MDQPIPVPSSLDGPYWEGAKAGKLMLQRCAATGRHQWYPRAHSLHRPGAGIDWVEASGRGVLETYTVVHRSFYPQLKAPYVIAVVRLEEGVLFSGHLIGVAEGDIRICMPLEVTFEKLTDDVSLACFKAR